MESKSLWSALFGRLGGGARTRADRDPLGDLADLLGLFDDAQPLIERALDAVVRAGAASASAWLRDPDAPGFRFVACCGEPPPPLPTTLPASIAQWLSWLGGASAGDTPGLPPEPPPTLLPLLAGLGADLIVPLRGGFLAEGALLIRESNDRGQARLDPRQMEALATRIGRLVGRLQSSWSSGIGGPARLNAYSMFRIRQDEELARAERCGRSLGLLVLRLDPAIEKAPAGGAQVTRQRWRAVVDWLAGQVRGMDVMGLGASDELFVLLPEAEVDRVEATRVRLGVAAAKGIALPDGSVVNILLGGASYPQDALSAEFLMHAARQRARAAALPESAVKDKSTPAPDGPAAPPRRAARTTSEFPAIVSTSPRMREVMELVTQFARTNLPILIQGETGAGKGRLCEDIHQASARRESPLVKINCGAIPEGLIESELFGHERGAFTGAARQTRGKFEVASTGTLFLDEVDELSPSTQVKLLRVIEEGRFYRVGGTQLVDVDVRAIAATNRDLRRLVAAGRFREDLFYRIQGVLITVPPLRERLEDIPNMVDAFIQRFRRENDASIEGITPDARDLLFHHPWPGNVRELRAVVDRACALVRGPYVTRAAVQAALSDGRAAPAPAPASTSTSTPASRANGVPAAHDREARILELLHTRPEITAREIAEALGTSKSTIVRVLEDLVRADAVRRIGAGKLCRYVPARPAAAPEHSPTA
ncbi:MAG: sigma 54-interacting transcriptional regulator [Myxococcota bacterium]